MNAVELALVRQRLTLEAAAQREAIARHAAGLQPLFTVADQVHAGVRWMGRHPEVVVGGTALLAAVRPGVRRFLWHTGQRALVFWLWFGREFGQAGSSHG